MFFYKENIIKVLKPILFQSSQLISTDAVNTDPDYSSGATYALGDKVTYGTKVYESLQGSNTNHQPDTSPTWWLDLGANNQYAMFDEVIGTSTTRTDSLTVVYKPGSIFNSLSLINIDALVIKTTIRDGVSGPIVYENTLGLSGAESFSWSDYFFNDPLLKTTQVVLSDLPPYVNACLTLELTTETGGMVSLAKIVVGDLAVLGTSQYGASAGIVDYSIKETDEFGNTKLVKRAFSKRLNVSFNIENAELNRVQRFLYSIRATPVVWVASDMNIYEEALVVYGFYKDFTTEIAYPSFSQCSIEVESLT